MAQWILGGSAATAVISGTPCQAYQKVPPCITYASCPASQEETSADCIQAVPDSAATLLEDFAYLPIHLPVTPLWGVIRETTGVCH